MFRLNEPIDFISFSELGGVFMVNKRVNQTKKTYVYNKDSKWSPVQLNQLKVLYFCKLEKNKIFLNNLFTRIFHLTYKTVFIIHIKIDKAILTMQHIQIFLSQQL